MKKLLKSFPMAVVGCFFLTGLASADPVIELLKDVEVHGFASSSYSFNTNRPFDRMNGFRIFDRDDNSFKFDAGELVLLREPEKGEAGFRFDLSFGFSQPEVNKSTPGQNVTVPGLGTLDVSNDDFDVQQGYVSYSAPIGSGLQLDLGKFITHIGTELMDGYDGFNYTFSRSWGFGFGPFTHTGLRATYSFTDNFSVLAMIANGWDNETDENASKVWGTQVALTLWEGVSIYANWAGGLETGAGVVDGWRDIFDMVIDIQLSDSTLLNFDIFSGQQDEAVIIGMEANWWGISGILRHDVNRWFSVNFRGEIFNDDDGFRTGTAQELTSFTLTPEFRVSNNFVFRMEYRHDHSDIKVFSKSNGPAQTNDQNTFAAQSIFYF